MVRYNNERQIEVCFKCVPNWQQHLSCFISLHSLQILYLISLNSLWMLLRGKNKKAIQNVKHSLMCVFLSLQPSQLSMSQLFLFFFISVSLGMHLNDLILFKGHCLKKHTHTNFNPAI